MKDVKNPTTDVAIDFLKKKPKAAKKVQAIKEPVAKNIAFESDTSVKLTELKEQVNVLTLQLSEVKTACVDKVSKLEAYCIERDQMYEVKCDELMQMRLNDRLDHLKTELRHLNKDILDATADGLGEVVSSLIKERDEVRAKIHTLAPLLDSKNDSGLKLLKSIEGEENE